MVWGPGNFQGQILQQLANSQSPKILEGGMSPELGHLDAHSWDFVSPESDKDGERERLAMRFIRLMMTAAAAS